MDLQTVHASVNDAVALFKDTKAALDTKLGEVIAQTETNGQASKEALAAANKLAADLTATSSRIVEIEQKLAEGVQQGKADVKTLGQMVVASEQYTRWAQAGFSGAMSVQANTIIGQEGSPPENSDTLTQATRKPTIVQGAFRTLRIRDLIPAINISGNLYEFSREKTWTNNAAETAESAQKPESVLDFELKQAPVVTIAHLIKASRQILEDAPALAGYIDLRMTHGVGQRIDAQLLKGNGVGQNLSGLQAAGNFTAYTTVTGDTALDTLNRAKYAIIGADESPSAIVMNPADWGAIERLKDSESRYLVGNPFGMITPTLWGLPVVVSVNQTAGKFYMADFTTVATVANRSGVEVRMFEQDADNVQKNLITIRAEARLALGVEKPSVARYGDLAA
jgi:HK97 family phage major capsid protein